MLGVSGLGFRVGQGRVPFTTFNLLQSGILRPMINLQTNAMSRVVR